MFGKNWQWIARRTLLSCLLAVAVIWGITSCGDRPPLSAGSDMESLPPTKPVAKIEEVSPPEIIQQLGQLLEQYQPQVSISSPQPDEILQDNNVTIELQVQDLPIFKDPQLGLGPHLAIVLDNQTYMRVYDLNQPLVFKDLSPGTHTLRVFASRPWHESFKNEGAYAQTTFHIFTKTQDNNPNTARPLLTYNYPIGSYGAQPIMLDFYLTNAPLHLVARENPDDDILDWRIRCTVNGQSFILDQWEPIYLKGFEPGKNWVQLELLDELGNPIENNYNNTARLVTYNFNKQDPFSQLIRGELSITQALGIVDSNYIAPTPPSTPIPEPTSTPPTPTPEETVKPEAVEPETIEPEPSNATEEITPVEEEPTAISPVLEEITAPEEEKEPTASPVEETTIPIEEIPEVESTEPTNLESEQIPEVESTELTNLESE